MATVEEAKPRGPPKRWQVVGFTCPVSTEPVMNDETCGGLLLFDLPFSAFSREIFVRLPSHGRGKWLGQLSVSAIGIYEFRERLSILREGAEEKFLEFTRTLR